jgi:RNA polymerase sigma factor (sigma-70 family)
MVMVFINQDEDVDLIQRILSGDEEAFTALVARHRKWVHSLAWREIGDFHAAQEITQDTFIQTFKSLPTLRDPDRFLGWLYVIAKRQCIEWLRRKPITMQSLDAMPKAELERVSYTQHLEKERRQASTDGLREIVERLLQKLPETERSVMILHYFSGLTCEEVSDHLGLSLNTVKSRLYRARKRLEQEQSMLQGDSGPNLLKNEPRYIGIQATAETETGEHLAEGGFDLSRTDKLFTSIGARTIGLTGDYPLPMYMLLRYVNHNSEMDIFRFPLVVGGRWEQEGPYKSKAVTVLEAYETIEISAGTFPSCLKHKTVFTEADVDDTNAESQNAFVNGTRYLWFAEGIGLVKMRYEHANGVVTEAELLAYEIPVETQEYLPVQVGTQWTYKWHNDYSDEPISEKWRVIRNFNHLKNLDNPMALASARYAVKIDATERRIAYVECVLTPKISKRASGERKPLLLSMSRFGTEWLYDGYARYLQDLMVIDGNGKTLPVEEIGKTQWVVETENDLPLTLRYKVLLNHDEREWPPGPDEAPYIQEDCIFCPGYALFVVSEVDDIELCVDVPESWHVSTPWERVDPDGHRFVCNDQDDLMYAYLVLGEHRERLVKAGDTETVLALGGHFKASMNEIQGPIEALLNAYSEIFGGTLSGRMLVVANRYGKKGHSSGGASGRSVTMLIGGELDEASRRFWLPLVDYMICCLWISSQAINFREQEYWFSAGFTEYYSKIVSARLGLISESEFLERFERGWESYLSRQGQLSIREAGKDKSANRELVYDGGSLVAAALDLQIRNLTQNRSSLDNVMQQMRQEFGLTDNAYTMNDVIRITSQIAGEDLKPFFSKYMTGTERLPLEEYFKHAGMDVKIEFGERLPSLRYVLFKMLQIKSLGGAKGGCMFIHHSPQYQDDDELIGINGTPVKTFDDIRKVAKDWRSGDVVALTLEREGKEIILPVRLGGDTSEKPPLETGPIDVTITKRADRTDLQRAIWSGILGKRGAN